MLSGRPEDKSELRTGTYRDGLLFTLGNPAPAKALVQKALSINPNFIEARNLLAITHLAEEQYDPALTEIETALKVNPNSLSLHGTRASIYYLMNDTAKFDKSCKDVIAVNPKPALFYYTLGNNCMRQMLYLEAQPFYKKAVELDPKFWEGYIALGLNGLKCGPETEAEAIKLLEEAHNRDPFHPTVINSLKSLTSFRKNLLR